jgi:hypothetical protein
MTERSTRYERIAQMLGTLIKHGVLRPGDRLRSPRQRLSAALAAMTHAGTAHFPAVCRLTRLQGGYMLGWKCPSPLTHYGSIDPPWRKRQHCSRPSF